MSASEPIVIVVGSLVDELHLNEAAMREALKATAKALSVQPNRISKLKWISTTSSRVKLAKDVRPGRNASCSCGSGKKFKQCCGRSI
jgi:uncharacterized protein YecA (UPF0149 family)